MFSVTAVLPVLGKGYSPECSVAPIIRSASGRIGIYALERSGQRFYVATDQLGTPKAVTDVSGAVVKAVDYDSWGVKMSDSNSSFDLPVGFAGGILDAATGRWAAKDPIFFEGKRANLFGYTFNDSVNFVDPDGEFAAVVYFALAKVGAIGAAYVGSKYAATFADWWNRKTTDPCGRAGSGKGVGDVNRAFGKIGAIGAAEIGGFGAINAAVVAGPTVAGAVLANPQAIINIGDFTQGAAVEGLRLLHSLGFLVR